MFSFETCLQSGGKEGVQLLNTLFTVYKNKPAMKNKQKAKPELRG